MPKDVKETLLSDLKDAEWSITYHEKKLRDSHRIKDAVTAELEQLTAQSQLEEAQVSNVPN